MADAKLTALTETSVIDVADMIYTVDVSDTTDDAAGSSRKISVTRLGGYVIPSLCNGRLTTETGVPISTSDRTAQSTIYFTPYNGNRVSLYDGTRWKLYAFTERSLVLSSLTSGKNYDVFLYDNSGTLTLELSAAWTDDTTRNDALTTQDGIYVKSGATTRRYLGTIRTTGTTTTEDSGFMTTGPRKRFVWNLYNQVSRPITLYEATDSWTYNSSTWRSANNSANNRLEVVAGLTGGKINAQVLCVAQPGSSGGDSIHAIGEDSTSSPLAEALGRYAGNNGTSSPIIMQGGSFVQRLVPLGYHYYQWIEKSQGGNTYTIYGDAGGDHAKSGVNGEWPC